MNVQKLLHIYFISVCIIYFIMFIYLEPHHNQPPRIIRRSSRVSVSVGQKATLSCLAQGNPVPSYRWHKVAGELRTLPDLGSTVRQEGGVLVFPKVVPADAGTYICEVSNSVGQDKVEAELIVEGMSLLFQNL